MKNLYLSLLFCTALIIVSCGYDEIADIDLESTINWSSLSSYEMNWYEADTYCTNLNERGHDDWHLPSAEELETVVKNYTGNPCLENDIHCLFEYRENKEIYYSKTGEIWLWTNDEGSYINDTPAMRAVMFLEDHMQTMLIEFYENYHVRCVRSKCTSGYSWNNGKCETAPTKTADCTGLPANASWNSVSSITQTWNGSDWIPTNLEGTYSEEPSTTECRFKCNSESVWNGEICEKTYTDLITGLMWSPISFDSMDWYYAMDYCDNLSLFGYNDWHLPTISELRTLIRNCYNTETGGECGVTDTCLSFEECFNDACGGCYEADYLGKYSKLDENRPLWSSSTQSDDADFAWYVYFRYPLIDRDYKSGNIPVRCVRSE